MDFSVTVIYNLAPDMTLTIEAVEEIRELIEAGSISALRKESVEQITLPGAIEFACCRTSHAGKPEIVGTLDGIARTNHTLGLAVDTILGKSSQAAGDMFGTRSFEFFPILEQSWNDNDHHLFESRFTKSVKEAGFGSKAAALAGAFYDMADNVIQHSGHSTHAPARGLLGYHVFEGGMCFAVGDVGRGVLASLRENPQWQTLTDSLSALEMAVIQNASRRLHVGDGTGFKQMFKSLADLNGHLTFRSGDAFLRISGSSGGRQSIQGCAAASSGFQLSVTCCLRGNPRESFI